MKELSDEDQIGITRSMMLNGARSCLDTMKILAKQTSDFSSWFLPFYILGGICLELSPKIFLLDKMAKEGKNSTEIENFSRTLSHDLSEIYIESVVGENFLNQAGILKVEAITKPGVFHYIFSTKDFKDPILVYRAESIKYGLMTGVLSNLGFVAWQPDNFLKLVENVFKVSISS